MEPKNGVHRVLHAECIFNYDEEGCKKAKKQNKTFKHKIISVIINDYPNFFLEIHKNRLVRVPEQSIIYITGKEGE